MTKYRVVINTFVNKVYKHEFVESGRKIGDESILVMGSEGWFIGLEGSRESLGVGHERPPAGVKKGCKARIIVEIETQNEDSNNF